MSSTGTRTGRPRGYTAVEVLLAMTVMIITTAGVMSMQKTAIQGNLDARKMDAANAIAQTWLDRLATDATAWNSKTPTLGSTQWLSALGPAFSVPAVANGLSPAFDIMGRDLITGGDPTTVFCATVKLDPLAVDATANPMILRATVLVFWPKALVVGGAPAVPLCVPGAVIDAAALEAITPGTYHVSFATEALRRAA